MLFTAYELNWTDLNMSTQLRESLIGPAHGPARQRHDLLCTDWLDCHFTLYIQSAAK